MTRFVVLDHVDGGLQCLVMDSRGEGGQLVESEENPDVQELVFRHTQVCEDGSFYNKRESGTGGYEVNRCDEFIDTGVKESVCWAINRMDIRLAMTLEVDQLYMYSDKSVIRSSAFEETLKDVVVKMRHT